MSTRRKDKGLGQTARGGNAGSYAAHEREDALSPRERMEQRYRDSGTDLSYEEDYRETHRIATHAAMRVSPNNWVDRDDIVQDAVIRVLEQQVRDGSVNISKSEKEGGKAGIVVLAVNHSIHRVANQGEHHTAVAGRKLLKQRQQELEADLGRELTRREYSDLAEEVRQSYEAGRRPAKGYHLHRVEQLSLNERDDDGNPTNFAAAATEDSYPSLMDDRDDAHIRGLYEQVAAGKSRDAEDRERGITPAQGRKQLWSTYSDENPDIPQTRPIDDPAERKKYHSVVRDAGGTYKLAGRWLDGEEVTADEEDALFAAWGGSWHTTTDQRIAIAEKLTENQRYADHLWVAAMGLPPSAAQRN